MKKYNIIETIRLFVMQAQTHKAIDELYQFCNQNNMTEFINKIALLSSSLTEIKNSEILGLGSYIEEKNRINLALLQIIQKLDSQLSKQDKIITTGEKNSEKINLIESKIDFILRHIEINDDIDYYGFNNSSLWKQLETSSQEALINAHIIEKEAKQDNYADAILLYLNPVLLELNEKFLSKFKASLADQDVDKRLIIDEFKGNNKDKFYKYLKEDYELSLNQVSEILLKNVLLIDKNELSDLGMKFYQLFYKVYKLKDKGKIVDFFEFYSEYRLKTVRAFSQTLVDVIFTKKNVVQFFVNLQPK